MNRGEAGIRSIYSNRASKLNNIFHVVWYNSDDRVIGVNNTGKRTKVGQARQGGTGKKEAGALK